MTFTKSSSGLRIPSNAVPLFLLNVFLHILHLSLPLLESCITIFPCPIFPLDGHASFRQHSWEVSIFRVPLAFLFFIYAIEHHGCLFYKSSRTFVHRIRWLYPTNQSRGIYPSISEAVNAAHAGEEVRVFPGIYEEDLTIDKEIQLVC